MLPSMKARDTHFASTALIALILASTCACVDVPLSPELKNISSLASDERVIVGLIRYTNGDIRESLPKNYKTSYPALSYDLWHVAAETDRRSTFGPQGGVFIFKVKRQPVYLDSIWAVTGSFWFGFDPWYFPITLKFPVTNDNCVFVGTLVVSVSGVAPSGLWWPGPKPSGNSVPTEVVDTYERDRAALSTYVEGCDLKRALAEHPSSAEVEAVLAPLRAAERAEERRLEKRRY